ncbi:hypothetical protein JOC26_002092 [Sporohalobacter salinus]|nr:hypothetical protein [Sporohalobacter salinus]
MKNMTVQLFLLFNKLSDFERISLNAKGDPFLILNLDNLIN